MLLLIVSLRNGNIVFLVMEEMEVKVEMAAMEAMVGMEMMEMMEIMGMEVLQIKIENQ